jgi:hypothetical protein
MNSLKEGLMFKANKGAVRHVISDDLLQKTEGAIHTNWCGKIRGFHHTIPEVSKTTIHKAVQKTVGMLGAQNVNRQSQNKMDGCRAKFSCTTHRGR